MDPKQIPAAPADLPVATVEGYERPRIEVLMTAEDVSREILYAGAPTPNV